MSDIRLQLPTETYDLLNAMSIRSTTSISTIIREILSSTPRTVNLERSGLTTRYKINLDTDLSREDVVGLLNWRAQQEKPSLEKWRDSYKPFTSSMIEGLHYLT